MMLNNSNSAISHFEVLLSVPRSLIAWVSCPYDTGKSYRGYRTVFSILACIVIKLLLYVPYIQC